MLRIHSIETFGTHEGPGIRLVLFTQGCHFRCLYCHNPDTQVLSGGKEMTIEELVMLAKKQKSYFGSEGGVTVSGGEPTLQARGVTELFQALHKEGISTALDTNGALLNDDVKELYTETDTILLDVKHIDKNKHRILTGMSNENTLALADYRESLQKPMWLRYVLVPGFSDDETDMRRFGKYFQKYRHIERMEVLPYHTLGSYKYTLSGRRNPLEGVLPPSRESIDRAVEIFKHSFHTVTVR